MEKGSRRVNRKKKNRVINFSKGVAAEKKEFWKNLYTNEADLAIARDNGEIREH